MWRCQLAAYLVDAADTPHRKWRAGLRCRHLRDLDRRDQPPAPHHWTSVPDGARARHRDAVWDPPRTRRSRGERPQNRRAPLPVDDIKILLATARDRSRAWADNVLEGSRDMISVMVVVPLLDSCDYVVDNVLGYVGLLADDFHT